LSTRAVAFSRRARDEFHPHDLCIRLGPTRRFRGFSSPMGAAWADHDLPTDALAGAAGDFWAGVRLSLLSDVFALRRRGGHHARRFPRRVAGRRAALEMHTAASGRIGPGAAACRTSSSYLYAGDCLIFEINSDHFL
jgi:hypothetical protein